MLPAAVTKTITAKYPGYNFVGDDLERHVYPDNSIQYKVKLRHPSTQDKVELVLSADSRILCEDD